MHRTFLILAAVFGLLGVLAGTFGAHGLVSYLDGRGLPPERPDELLAIFQTGARYHMYHALALLGLASAAQRIGGKLIAVAGWLFTLGIIVFAGSLYTLALTNLSWLGAITPIGGACFLLGWLMLILAAIRARP